MTRSISYTIFFIALLSATFSFAVQAQNNVDFKELIDASKIQYEQHKNYQISTTYRLYKHASGIQSTPQESYSGFYALRNGDIYSKIGPIEIINQENTLLNINHDHQEIFFLEATNDGVDTDPVAIDKFIGAFQNVEVKKTAYGWVCVLDTPKDTSITPYLSVELELDVNHYVTKQRLVPLKLLRFKGNDNSGSTDRVIVEITFSKPSKLTDDSIFNLSNYIIKKGVDLIPANGLKNYELIKA